MTLDTSTIQPNEVVKAEDWSFGLDAQVTNIGVALASVLESRQSFVIGGNVSPYGGGLNVSVAPLFGVVNETINSFLDTEAIEPVPISPSPGNTRIDIIEVQGEWEEYDQQQRAFMDFETDIQTFQNINTKKRHKVNVRVKTGTPGSVSAPTVSDGWVKLAEIHVPADAVEITENDIKNITADIAGIENTSWTNEKTATYNIGYISDVNNRFRTAHNNDGTHKDRAITPNAIAIGTGNNELSGSNLPTGKIVTVSGQQLANTSTLADTIISLATKITDLFNKYLVNGAYNLNGEVSISDVVDAGTSTLTNAIKIGAAGDGTGYIKIGNRQVLKFTANTVQAATGYNATNALDFITKSVTDALNETVTNLSEDFEDFKRNLNSTTYSNTVLSRFKVGEQLYAATIENIALSGLQTLDGVVLQAGVKVLVKDQTNQSENGIYEVNANVWQRDSAYLIDEGIKYKLFEIVNGTTNKGKIFFTPLEAFKVGTDILFFEESIYSKKRIGNKVVMRGGNGKIEDVTDIVERGNDNPVSSNGVFMNALPIGTIIASILDAVDGFLLCDGTEYDVTQYPRLGPALRKLPFNADVTEGKFRVPDLRDRFIQGANGNLGTMIEAGLPNITGGINGGMNEASYSGAFTPLKNITASRDGGGVSTMQGVSYDASKGETRTDGTLKTDEEYKVYGKSDTVQPPAFTVNYMIKY